MPKNEVRFEGALDQGARLRINQNLRDVCVQTSTVTVNASTTNVALPGMTTGVLEPGLYTFTVDLGCGTAAAAGIKVAFRHSVASGMLSNAEFSTQRFTASALTATRNTNMTSGNAIIATTTAVVYARVVGSFRMLVPGTLTLEAAQNASDATDTTFIVGSQMQFERAGD